MGFGFPVLSIHNSETHGKNQTNTKQKHKDFIDFKFKKPNIL